MAYEFSSGRPLREEVSRLLADELDGAIAQLQGQREAERVKAVHTARKHLKKARSVLRLVRGPLGEKAYARENGRLRDAGLRLSDVRDAQVAVATLDALSQRFGDLPEAAVGGVRGVLVSRRDAASEQAGGGADLVAEVVAKLDTSRERLERLRLDRGGWKALQGGLELAYDRGATAARRAEAKPTLDRLHEWRKRVKDSWYHLRLLSPAWPEALTPLSEQAHRLSELLGDDHDLGVLRATLAGDAGPFDGAAELTTLVAQVDRRRAELQREAFRLGRRFYAESTKAFIARLAAYWDTWRDEAPLERDQPAEQRAAEASTPRVLAEPQLPRPALGSVEPTAPTPRPAVILDPQLAAPALGSIERAPSTPAPPRPAAPVLPTPALGSHERPATAQVAPKGAGSEAAAAGQFAPTPGRDVPAMVAPAPAVSTDSAGAPQADGSAGNGTVEAVAAPVATAQPSRRRTTRAKPATGAGAGDGDPEVGPAAGASAAGRPSALEEAEPARARQGTAAARRTGTRAADAAARPQTRTPKAAAARPRTRSDKAAAAAGTPQVVATLTGRRYHRPNCTLAGANARPLTREEAVAAGLAPCATCRP